MLIFSFPFLQGKQQLSLVESEDHMFEMSRIDWLLVIYTSHFQEQVTQV